MSRRLKFPLPPFYDHTTRATEKSDVLGLRMTPNQPASPPLPGKNLSVAWITLFEDSNCTIESIRMIDGAIYIWSKPKAEYLKEFCLWPNTEAEKILIHLQI